MTDKTYTIEELEALPDADLNALAAELLEAATVRYMLDKGYSEQAVKMHRQDNDAAWRAALRWGKEITWDIWSPATDCNQSRELLDRLVEQPICRASYTIKLGCGKLFAGVRVEWIDGNNNFQDVQVNGTSARSETIAFCAATVAQKGKLK